MKLFEDELKDIYWAEKALSDSDGLSSSIFSLMNSQHMLIKNDNIKVDRMLGKIQ